MRQLFFAIFILISVCLKAQCPSIALSVLNKQYCTLDEVEVTANGVPTGSTLQWKTDTSWINGAQAFKFTIQKPGFSLVQLQVTLSNKTVCYYSDSLLFTALPLPQPQMAISRNLLCFGADTVTLADNTPTSARRSWIINGVTYSNVAKQTLVTFPPYGMQHATLVVDDSAGCRAIREFQSVVGVFPDPALDFSIDQNKNCYPLTTNYTSTFNLAGQSVKSLLWSLPGSDKDNAATANVSNAGYFSTGVFNASVYIETWQGCSYKKEKYGFISLGDTASLGLEVAKKNLCLSEPVLFTQTNVAALGSHFWKIGSFSQKPVGSRSMEMTFRDTGWFSLELTHNHNGCISKKVFNNVVKVSGLKADFLSDNAFHCDVPHKVNIINNSDTVSATISGYKWKITDADDQNTYFTSADKNIDVVLKQLGKSYDVQLVVTAAGGCSDTALKKGFISARRYAFAFSATPHYACPFQPVRYINNTPAGSYYGLDQFSWEFLGTDKKTVLGKSADLSPKFTYKDTGTYHTRLIAANPLGCNQDSLAEGVLRVIKPKVKFNMQSTVVCLNDSVLCRGISEPADAGFIHSWRFTHKKSGKFFELKGNDIKVAFTALGDYEMKCWLDITSACNDTATANIFVNGIDGTLRLDSLSGCSPFVLSPKFEIKNNFHQGYADSNVKFNWSTEPSAGVIMNGTRSATPAFTIQQDGSFSIVLFVSNSAGCGVFVRSTAVKTGVKSILQLSSNKACVNTVISANTAFYNNPDYTRLLISPAGSNIKPLDSANYEISFNKAGKYTLMLLASRNGSCFDTARQTVDVIDLRASFAAKDTQLSCAPVMVQFVNTSLNADSLYWITGDGLQKDTLAGNYLHRYASNSGFGNAFDVQLIAASSYGCRDTLIRRKYISVTGPVPAFTISNSAGCNPLKVIFKDSSRNVKFTYFDYGDGSKADTNKFGTHIYFNTGNTLVANYSPVLYARDSGGCLGSFSLSKPLEVYQFPKIKLVVSPDTVVCQRERITVRDTGRYGGSYWWYVNGVLKSNAVFDSLIIEDEGLNKITVITANGYGCADTAVQIIQAKTSDPIKISHPEILCTNKPVLFTATVLGNDKPINYTWNFGETGSPENYQVKTTNSAAMTYRSPGIKIIMLEAKLPNGCKVPNYDTLEVFNSGNIPALDLKNVNIDSLNRAEVHYPNPGFNYFRHFNLFRNDTLILTDTLNTANYMLDVTNVTAYDRVCYYVTITDKCETEGKKGRLHCPVLLKVSSPADKTALLEWSYYVGWNRVEKYKIYRSHNGKPFQLVDEVFGTIKTYTDTDLCNTSYTYLVQAVKEGETDSAFSNRASVLPKFAFNTALPMVENVSVNMEEAVEVRWKKSNFKLNESYDVLRYDGSLSVNPAVVNTTDTFFTDNAANPSSGNLFYRIKEVDRCGNKTAAGRYAKTIWLKGENVDKVSYLKWDSYEIWDFPTVNQSVYFIPEDKSKLFIATLDPDVFTYNDIGFYPSIDGYYQYKVAAVNAAGDSSFSNRARVPGKPVYFVPSSFSPNIDGINDKFSFYSLFVTSAVTHDYKDFEVLIYNRWGQLVYQSNNIKDAWDGNYQGQPAPQGMYVVKMRLTGSDESRNYVKQTLMLLR